MENSLTESIIKEFESPIIKAILEKNIVSPKIIEELVTEKNNLINEAKDKLQAICYTIDYHKRALVVFNFYTQETICSVSLANKFKRYELDELSAWGDSALIISQDELKKEGAIKHNMNHQQGFVVFDNKPFLYTEDLENEEFLAETDKFLHSGKSKVKDNNVPFDMFFSQTHQFLGLSNRLSGEVVIFSVKEENFVAEISTRDRYVEIDKSVNVAISESKRRIYLTDNETSFIHTYSMITKKPNKKNMSNLGILGNIVLSPDELNLYVMVLKPDPSIKILDAENFEIIGELPIKGDLFSLSDDPCDLFSITPDNNHLCYMTYLNEPEPFTPVINIINLEKGKLTKRFSIKDGSKPITIAFKEENPLFLANKKIEEVLIEKGYLTQEKLDEIKDEIERNKKAKEEDIEGLIDVKQEQMVIIKEYERPIPKKIKHIVLPTKANKIIKEVLLGDFWHKSEIDLSEIKDENERLDNLSNNIRTKLEYYDLEPVEIENFYENYSLDCIVTRDYVLKTISEEEAKNKEKVVSSPSNCSSCGAPMYGSWDCSVCGQSYEKPEDAARREVASFTPLTNIQNSNFIILDQEKGLVIELDKFRTPIWTINKSELELKSITKAYRLDNNNSLILDKTSNTILEISSLGREVWKSNLSENSKIYNPDSFSILYDSDLIIADTKNHRVIQMDMDNNIIWHYGTKNFKGSDFNFLNTPKDIQKTYDDTYLIADSGNNRILELKREINVAKGEYEIKEIWHYNKELNNPTQVYKDLDGTVFILDHDNYRVIQIDQEGNIIWEFNTTLLDEKYIIKNIQSFLKLRNKDILIIGDGKVLQVFQDGSKSKLVWAELIENLVTKTKLKITQEHIKIAKERFISKKYKSNKFGKSKYEEILEKARETRKRLSAKHYMGKHGDKKDGLLSKEERESKIKLVNAKHYIGKQGENSEEFDEEFDEEGNKIKLVNAKHYIGTYTGKEDEEDIIENEKNEELERLIEEKKRALENRVENVPTITLTHGETVLPFPILIIEKNDKLVMVLNREGNTIWQYGNSRNQELKMPKNITLTSEKTIVITDLDRVFEVSLKNKEILWEYETKAKFASKIKNGNYLICDEKEARVIEVDHNKNIIWEYHDKKPFSHALRLANGNTLLTSSSEHLVKEIDSNNKIIWTFGENESVEKEKELLFPENSVRLKNGNTLITDCKNGRIIEVSKEKDIVWSYHGNHQFPLISPTYSARLKDEHTYIIHSNYKHIIEVDLQGKMIWRLVMPHKF
ncbi:MAG: hypothetical protein U0457_19050 [Candidatus Sericytochromatia bacterium]